MLQGQLSNVLREVTTLQFDRPVRLNEQQTEARWTCALDIAQPLRNTDARLQPKRIGVSLALIDR
jgi:hypothetical protein